MDPFTILTDNSFTMFYNKTLVTATNGHRNWTKIVDAVRAKDWDAAYTLINQVDAVRAYAETSPAAVEAGIEIRGNSIYFDGTPLNGALVERILRMREEEFDFEPMLELLKNIQANPSYRAREQLYSFLESNQLPITPDGCFMAYKSIRDDWKDIYTGTIDNSVGQKVTMNRFAVDDDPNRTCSAGLHVCSLEYLKSYRGQRLVAVKVNPADVVSVPTDYNNSKMRVCAYEVIEELPIELIAGDEDYWDEVVVGYDNNDDDDDDTDDEPDSEYADGYDFHDDPLVLMWFKIFDERGGAPATLFHGVEGSRTLPLSRWLQASIKEVSDGGTRYMSGFHILKSFDTALDYLKYFKNIEDKVIVEVRVSIIRPKFHARSQVFLAERLFIPKSAWQNRVYYKARDLLAA